MNMPLKSTKIPVAIFASGNGTNFSAIQKATLPIEIKLLVCDHTDAPVLQRAAKVGIPTLITVSHNGISKEEREQVILRHLKAEGIKAIFLAGYMKIIGSTLLDAYPKRILNIHPALLPNFPGRHGIEDAFKAGVAETGVTIHYIDSGIDTGQVIGQVKVPRFQDDTVETLASRIHAIEHKLYPQTILNLIQKGVL